MKIELIKYRDAGMNSYTYFWKDENHHTVSPYFDTEAEAMDWAKEEKADPKILDDERAFDEVWAEMERKQTWKDS